MGHSIDRQAIGRKAHRAGSDFEARVWRDLWEKKYITTKWNNNLNEDYDIVQAKQGRFRRTSNGFPDFIYYNKFDGFLYGVECKVNGKLSKIEKEKCKVYLQKRIFSKIFIASKEIIKNKIKINYKEFK